jgi:putative PIN family toxin of toxin-antitoxin system
MTSDPQGKPASDGIARVVFDANIYFQAILSSRGPAGRCLAAAEAGWIYLFASEPLLDEFAEVCQRPHLVRRFNLSPERVAEFMVRVRSAATFVGSVPRVFNLPRDPKDEMVIDLAVAAHASLIVSRDKDLLELSDPATADREDAAELRQRFPHLRVIGPVELLERLHKAER